MSKTCWAELMSSNQIFLVEYENDCGAQCMKSKTGRLTFISEDDSLKVTCTRHGLDHKAKAIVRIKGKDLAAEVSEENNLYYDLRLQEYVVIDLKEWSGCSINEIIPEIAV